MFGESHPVAEKKPNPWGCYDMLGNLWEWCADAYDEDFYRKRVRDDPFVADGRSRVLRGGSWTNTIANLRCPNRVWLELGYRDSYMGFRCARDL